MFLISIILIVISSYLITSLFYKNEEKNNWGIIYILLIMFAQIILSFEILSLLSLIDKIPFLVCNFVIFLISAFIWGIKDFPLFKFGFIGESKKIYKALKRDKLLFFTALCFIVLIVSGYLTVQYHPIIFGDALSYYLPRATAWIQNGNINHFVTPDARELIMPVNLDILYMMHLMFTKSEYGVAIYSYISFISLLYVVYNFLGEFGFSRRKRLWSIFTIASFIVIAVMAYTPCADVLIGTLLLTSLYLFFAYLKYDKKTPLYFSTLAAALAFGTKTTSIIAFPSVFILLIIMIYLFKKNKIKEGLGLYLLLLFINFMIFSSYNYILNIIQFSNPVSNSEYLMINKFRGGIKGYLCNLIKYIFIFFDASAIKDIDFYHRFIAETQEKVLGLIGENSASYMSDFFNEPFLFGYSFSVAKCGLGVMGILAFIPSLFCALKKGLKKSASPKIKFLAALALSLIFNVLLFSRVMVYTKFNFRYIVTFIVIAIPIVVFSYIKSNKNLYKYIMIFFLFIYLLAVSHKEMSSIFLFYHNYKKLHPEVKNIQSVMTIEGEEPFIFNYFIQKNRSKIAMLSNKNSEAIYHIVKLRLFGFNVDRLFTENITDFKIDRYNYIILPKEPAASSNLLRNNPGYCSYLDWEKHQLTIEDDLKNAAMSLCLIPMPFFYENGFVEDKDAPDFNNYIILKR